MNKDMEIYYRVHRTTASGTKCENTDDNGAVCGQRAMYEVEGRTGDKTFMCTMCLLQTMADAGMEPMLAKTDRGEPK